MSLFSPYHTNTVYLLIFLYCNPYWIYDFHIRRHMCVGLSMCASPHVNVHMYHRVEGKGR